MSFAIIFDPVFSSEYQASRLFPSSLIRVTFKAFYPTGTSSLGTHVPGKIVSNSDEGITAEGEVFSDNKHYKSLCFFFGEHSRFRDDNMPFTVTNTCIAYTTDVQA